SFPYSGHCCSGFNLVEDEIDWQHSRHPVELATVSKLILREMGAGTTCWPWCAAALDAAGGLSTRAPTTCTKQTQRTARLGGAMAGGVLGRHSGADDHSTEGSRTYAIIVCVFASLGGWFFGYDQGVTGGVLVMKSCIGDWCVGWHGQTEAKRLAKFQRRYLSAESTTLSGTT
ncbi:hypothetical protein PybrP1_012217, partial [[Pythium] brassicae (nom. inval.)]